MTMIQIRIHRLTFAVRNKNACNNKMTVNVAMTVMDMHDKGKHC